ncbi:MAG: hypothetical protein ABII82_11590, partial [Verrucomicrobiota bacterium]
MKPLLSLLAILCLGPCLRAAPEKLLVLAQDFQFPGGWMTETRAGSLGTRVLRTPGTDLDALVAVNVSSKSEYAVWARALDFTHERPGARRFTVEVNGARLPGEAGDHGHDGWAWERLGAVRLDAGETMIGLVDTARFFGRCDAILLSADPEFDPNAQSRAALLRLKVEPVTLAAEAASAAAPPPVAVPATAGREVA